MALKGRRFGNPIPQSTAHTIPSSQHVVHTPRCHLTLFSCDRNPLGEPYHFISSLPQALPLIPFPLPSSLFLILSSVNNVGPVATEVAEWTAGTYCSRALGVGPAFGGSCGSSTPLVLPRQTAWISSDGSQRTCPCLVATFFVQRR